MPDSSPHSDLPPVSYEALAENNRHTHANLDACIEARTRLEEQLETYRDALERIEDYGRRREFNIYAGNMAEMAAAALLNPAKGRDA